MTSLPCFAEVCSLSVRHGLFIYSGAGRGRHPRSTESTGVRTGRVEVRSGASLRGSSGDVGVNGGGGLFPAVVGRRSGVLQLHAASSARGFICTRIQLHAALGACGLFCVNRPRLGLTAAASPLSLLFLAEFLVHIFGFSARAPPRVLVEEQKTPPAEKACVLLCGH